MRSDRLKEIYGVFSLMAKRRLQLFKRGMVAIYISGIHLLGDSHCFYIIQTFHNNIMFIGL
jgi:hypothetical protein